jgi:hypothetical protein
MAVAPFCRRDRGVVGDRLAPGGLDLLRNLVCGARVVACAVPRAAQVIDEDLRPFAREEHGMGAPDAAARTRNDSDLAIEKTHMLDSLENEEGPRF